MTAGTDAIRSLAPKQIYALEWRITLDGFFQAPGSTGSPSSSSPRQLWQPLMGVPSASGGATGDCCRHAIGFSTHEQTHTIRAFLFACATETSRAGRRSSRLLSQPASVVDLLRECRITAVAPSTSSRRR